MQIENKTLGACRIGALHQLASSIRAAGLIAVSQPFANRWCESIFVPQGFFDNESAQCRVCFAPARIQEPGELVRIDFDLDDDMSDISQIATLLRMELEPFIIGVGQVRVEQLSEHCIIARAN